MRKYKRFIAVIMSVVLLLATTAHAADVDMPTDIENSKYRNAIELVLRLGIMTINSDWEFLPDTNATRAEVAQAVVGMLNLGEINLASGTEQPAGNVISGEWMGSSIEGAVKKAQELVFEDVERSHEAYSAIKLAVGMDIMTGYGDGTFRPEQEVTYAEVMTVFVKLLGFEELAKKQGGFPNGYVKVAQKQGINKYVALGVQSAVTRGELAALICTCLEMDICEVVSYGSDVEYAVSEGKTLFSERFNMYKLTGIVTATQMTGLYSSHQSVAADKVKIGSDEYYHNGFIGEDMLGEKLTVYYEEDDFGDRSIVYVIESSKENARLSFYAEDFVKYEGGRIYYEDGDEKQASFKTESDVPVIYNGVYADILKNFDLNTVTAKSADFTLLDSDADGYTDALFVNCYQTYVVRRVNASESLVYVTDVTKSSSEIVANQTSTEYLPLDFSDSNVYYRIFRDGAVSELSSIREDTVLSVGESLASSDSKWTTVHISSDKVSGRLDGSDGERIQIDGIEYVLVPQVKITISVGTSGAFYLDAFGRVAAFSQDGNVYDYGYFIKAGQEEADDVSWVRLFTKRAGDIETIKTTEKIKLNGETVYAVDVPAALDAAAAGNINRLVAYKTNQDGFVKEILTPTIYNTWTDGRDGADIISNLVINRQPVGILSTYTNKAGTDGPGVRKKREANRTNFSDFMLAENGVIFDLSSSVSDDWCIKTGMNNILNTRTYDCAGYNISYGNLADIMVIFPEEGQNSTGEIGDVERFDDKVVVISEAKVVATDDGDIVFSIKGHKYGAAVEYTLDYYRGRKKADQMHVGDVWQIEADPKGRVTRCSELFDAKQDFENVKTYRESTNSYEKSLGIVKETAHNALVIGVSENKASPDKEKYLLWTTRLCQWGNNSTHVAWYDVTAGTVEVKGTTDIYPNDLVFVSTNWNVPEQIVVIKNYK